MDLSRQHTGRHSRSRRRIAAALAHGRKALWSADRWLLVAALGLGLIGCRSPGAGLSKGGIHSNTTRYSSNDTVRFLEQATFGPTTDLVAHVQDIGGEAFLDEQFNLPISNYPSLEEIWPQNPDTTCTGTCVRDNYTMYPMQQLFFQYALGAPDQVRQRVFFALGQIIVTSAQNPNLRLPSRMSYYLQTLENNTLGNFRQLLYDVTLNPNMGRYLDMVGNNRANPNENYAREILQLFSIGLFELNDDGTLMLDGSGNPIPTYDQDTVVSFARVFTGWNFASQPAPGVTNYQDPMVLNQAQHDVNPKTLLGGVVLDAGRPGYADLNDAIDNIFNHHNVGPFIGKQLIQKLVTSNPSPAYVARVTQAFNNNGSGVRGDLQAVVKAILLDPEARNENPGPDFGKLREPVLAITNLLREFNITGDTTDYVLGESYLPANIRLDEDVFRSPTVFNFFPPDYALPGSTTLVAPEFGIDSTVTALNRINLNYELVYHAMPTTADRPTGTWIDLTALEAQAASPDALVETLNTQMLHGTMSDDMRNTIVNAVTNIADTDLQGRAREGVYLVASSSPYQVQR